MSFDCHTPKNKPRNAVNSAFLGSCTLFKLAEFGLILGIPTLLPYHLVLITHAFSTHYFSFHIFLVPIQYHCILSLLCVVPVACKFFYYSQNNFLPVCLSTYENYNLLILFLQRRSFVVLIVSTMVVFYVLRKINYLCRLSLNLSAQVFFLLPAVIHH